MDNLYSNSEYIKELTSKDFKDGKSLPDKQGFLVAYSPNCGYCKTSTNLFNYVAKKIKPYNLFIGAINGTDKENGNDKVVEKLNVQGYPTIYTINRKGLQQGGKLVEFEPSRTVEALFVESFLMNNYGKNKN